MATANRAASSHIRLGGEPVCVERVENDGGPRTLLGTGRAVANLIRYRQVPFLAAGVAYYAFLSLVPLVLLLLAVTATLEEGRYSVELVGIVAATLTPSAADAFRQVVMDAEGGRRIAAVSSLVLIWGILQTFRALDTAFSAVHGAKRDTFDEALVDGALVFVVVAIAGSLMLVLGATFPAVPVVGDTMAPALLFGGLTVAFLPMFYHFPNADLSILDALPGALFAAATWTILQGAFSYVGPSGRVDTYGVLGVALLLQVWLYVTALVLLVGASLNAVIAGHARSP